MQKIINQTANGIVFKCSACNKFHIEFKNLNFNFTEKEFGYFTRYLTRLRGEETAFKNQNSYYRRKIAINIGHRYLNILLNPHELEELKALFTETVKLDKQPMLSGLKALTITEFLN